ncbi:chaperone SurA [gamma proteobacterium HTCC5015]|nr:chaperone SurA [gamma proteobacterium HTCC5015]
MMTMIARLLILFFLFATPLAQAEPQVLARIAAVVDTDIILEQEMLDELSRVKARIQASGQTPPPDEILKRQVLEHLIVKEVQMQAADRVGINVDDTFLNEQLQRIASENGMSLAQFKAKIESEGMDYVEYREMLREEMKIQQLRQRTVYDRVVVSEQEVDDYLAQNPVGSESVEYQLGHILVGTPEAATPEQVDTARKEADNLYEQIKQGARFSQLALSHSDGQRALDGGDLGWLPQGRVPSLFLEAIESLQKGQVSRPIRSPSGFHLVQLKGVRGDERRVIQQVRARHILLTPNAVLSDEQARQKIAELRRRIVEADESFAELAKAHSIDGSAAQGGDLGWAAPREYVPAFRQVVETLPLNTLSEPFRSDFGWHIVEVLERRQYDETDEYRRGMARQELRKMKASEEEELWLRRLRDQTYVEYRLGLGEDPDLAQLQGATP